MWIIMKGCTAEVSVTISSRRASMGGFVTWAKSCLKQLNKGWCFSDSTARGMSVPMEAVFSAPDFAGPVFQPLHNGQSVVYHGMTGCAVDIYHGTNAAGVVLKVFGIKGLIHGGCLL